MRVAVAGATGVIGRCLVPLLSEAGHEVTGLSRSRGTDLLDAPRVAGAKMRVAGAKRIIMQDHGNRAAPDR
jgi:nucleoside-diphosphate-sugar epimerase